MNPPEWLRVLTERVIGGRNAELHLSTSTMASPEEALSIGYVDKLVTTSEELLPAALEKCKKMISVPDLARSQCKQGFRKDVASLANHEQSIDVMADSVLGEEFQKTIDDVMKRLKGKKKKKKK